MGSYLPTRRASARADEKGPTPDSKLRRGDPCSLTHRGLRETNRHLIPPWDKPVASVWLGTWPVAQGVAGALPLEKSGQD